MSDLSTTAFDATPIQSSAFPTKLTITLVLTALADWLFYGHRIGISVALFAIALACAYLLANAGKSSRARAAITGLLVLAGLMPAVEEVNALSIGFIALALGAGLLLTTNPGYDRLSQCAFALADLFMIGPFRFFRDAVGLFNLPALTRGLIVWFVPAVLGTIFLSLFVSANPLFEKWIILLNPGNPSAYVSLARVLFWMAALSIVWPFIHVRWRAWKTGIVESTAPVATQEQDEPADAIDIFSVATILRSLILFNLLFAVQTVLDVVYLWGNATLPSDVSYASYAHRGAYPLIVTALLAAGFVLAAMRPGGPAEHSRVIRPLVYLWVAQNVLLVISSILRLDLYVQIYMLTYWRIAAFIWMLLVVLGLLWIVARIALNRSNAWLINANLMTLITVLYVCSLVNFAAIIADFNVNHSREVGGTGMWVDTSYLAQLGPQALPAIDRVLRIRGIDQCIACRRNSLVEEHRKDIASWRAWGFRSWRLQRYLDAQQRPPAG